MSDQPADAQSAQSTSSHSDGHTSVPGPQTNITGNVHGHVYSGAIGQVGDRSIDIGGGDYYERSTIIQSPTPDRPLFVGVPGRPALFVGRASLEQALVRQLCAGTTTALSVEGLPGVGKTTLAVMLAHHPRIRARFSDGILWGGALAGDRSDFWWERSPGRMLVGRWTPFSGKRPAVLEAAT